MKAEKYMSKEYTNSLRGILALVVVVHHLYQYTGVFRGTYIATILQLSGALSVAMFFFFSGYGLILSSKQEDYMEHFFRKRFLPLYSFYVVLIVLYSFWTLALERKVSLYRIVQSFFFGGTVVTNGWYFQVTFIAYLLFFLCSKLFKTEKSRIVSFAVGICLYCVFCYLTHCSGIVYQTVPCMILGMVWYRQKTRIDEIFKKHAWKVFFVGAVLSVMCVILSKFSGIDVVFDMLYAAFFVCGAVAMAYILCDTAIVDNRIFALCGKYSLEIYVSHGFFLRLMRLNYINNKLVYVAVVVIGAGITSVILKRIHTKVVSLFITGKQHHLDQNHHV